MSAERSYTGVGGPKSKEVVACRGLWKVFGEKAADAIAKEGLHKTALEEQHKCTVAVADVTFSVGRGEVFCVMGLSGSGKSTLIRCINRLVEPSAGEISINNQNVLSKTPQELRRLRAETLGMVFQNFGLQPHRTVRDNVALPLQVRGASKRSRYEVAERCLELVELAGCGDRFGHQLSGGMQQRVGLARALAADPDILLMDEPFSALDPLIRRQLQDEFIGLSQRMSKTAIFITHDLDEAIRVGDRIAIMKGGSIIQSGVPEEILTKPADDYVASFVAGISKLKLVYAHSVMKPIQHCDGMWPEGVDRAASAPLNADLDYLVTRAAQGDVPIAIVDEAGVVVGGVDQGDLLKGIKGAG